MGDNIEFFWQTLRKSGQLEDLGKFGAKIYNLNSNK
jgi:hypothetical protein